MFKTNANDQCCGSQRKLRKNVLFFSVVSLNLVRSSDNGWCVIFSNIFTCCALIFTLNQMSCNASVTKAVTRGSKKGKKILISGTRIASGWVRWVSKNCCVVPAFLQSSAMLGKLQNSWQFVLVNHTVQKRFTCLRKSWNSLLTKGFQQHGTVCIFLQLYCRASHL